MSEENKRVVKRRWVYWEEKDTNTFGATEVIEVDFSQQEDEQEENEKG